MENTDIARAVLSGFAAPGTCVAQSVLLARPLTTLLLEELSAAIDLST